MPGGESLTFAGRARSISMQLADETRNATDDPVALLQAGARLGLPLSLVTAREEHEDHDHEHRREQDPRRLLRRGGGRCVGRGARHGRAGRRGGCPLWAQRVGGGVPKKRARPKVESSECDGRPMKMGARLGWDSLWGVVRQPEARRGARRGSRARNRLLREEEDVARSPSRRVRATVFISTVNPARPRFRR